MDDLLYGTRDKRGNWAPNEQAKPAPIWQRPFSLRKVLAWVPEYLWPWNAFHLATAIIWVTLLIPSWESLATLSITNYLWLYGLNAAGLFVFLGSFELIYYVKRKQGTGSSTTASSRRKIRQTSSGSKARISTTSCGRSLSPCRCGRSSRS